MVTNTSLDFGGSSPPHLCHRCVVPLDSTEGVGSSDPLLIFTVPPANQ